MVEHFTNVRGHRLRIRIRKWFKLTKEVRLGRLGSSVRHGTRYGFCSKIFHDNDLKFEQSCNLTYPVFEVGLLEYCRYHDIWSGLQYCLMDRDCGFSSWPCNPMHWNCMFKEEWLEKDGYSYSWREEIDNDASIFDNIKLGPRLTKTGFSCFLDIMRINWDELFKSI